MDGCSSAEKQSRIFKPTVLLHEPMQNATERTESAVQPSSVWQRLSPYNYIIFPWLQFQCGGVTPFNAMDFLGPKTKDSCVQGCSVGTCRHYKHPHGAGTSEGNILLPKSASFDERTGIARNGAARDTERRSQEICRPNQTGFSSRSDCDQSSRHGITDTVSSDEDKKSNLRKKYGCPFCTVACSNMGQLRGHLRCHTGERPFVCSVKECSRKFARNEELTRHKRIHSGVRPFQCEVCKKSFGRKDHLQKHSKTHLTPMEKKVYLCPVCCQGYSRSDALKRHKATAHAQQSSDRS